jgi:predicted amidophosphoribosyltransferase
MLDAVIPATMAHRVVQGPGSASGVLWPGVLRLLPLEWLLEPPLHEQLDLPGDGLAGLEPLPWWAAGLYAGPLRRQLLSLRRHPRSRRLTPLLPGLLTRLRRLRQDHRRLPAPLLVAIPSWKRQGNPLPRLLSMALSRQLGWPEGQLLERSRPVLGQHRLGRDLRWQNQEGAFRCLRRADSGRQPVLVVDDILTAGATACSAAAALERAGWPVLGMACMGRTPWNAPGQEEP